MYNRDLAYVHDVGFTGIAREAGPAILDELSSAGLRGGLIVDLGCGSGIWAGELVSAGYDVMGIDRSSAMVAIARKRVPKAKFLAQSFYDARLPRCQAVTAIGEPFNYLSGDERPEGSLDELLGRIYAALSPGGMLIFDVRQPGRRRGSTSVSRFTVAEDWAVLVEARENPERRELTRAITTFRRVSQLYRRSEETHLLRLLSGQDLARRLRELGFRVRVRRGYGDLRLGPAQVAIFARKPRR